MKNVDKTIDASGDDKSKEKAVQVPETPYDNVIVKLTVISVTDEHVVCDARLEVVGRGLN